MSLSMSCSGYLYEVLEVEPTASVEEIRRQYKKKALQYHPDRHMGVSLEAFQEVEEAHRILSDSNNRFLYDLMGRNNMKMFGSNPAGQILLANLWYAVVTVYILLFLIGSVCVGLVLGSWRFDRQYATWAKGSSASFSWWWIAAFFLPSTLLVSLFSGYMAKLGAEQGLGCRVVLSYVLFAVLPLLVVVMGTLFLNGTIGVMPPFFLLVLCIGHNLHNQYAAAQQRTEEEHFLPEENVGLMKAVKWKAVLQVVFLCLLFARLLQSGPNFISCWILVCPLFVDFVWSALHPIPWSGSHLVWLVMVLYMQLMWTQKLNVEWNHVSGYEPRAWTCLLPVIFSSFALVVGCGIIGINARSIWARSRYDDKEIQRHVETADSQQQPSFLA